jgi:predicted dehydrogenase
MDRDVRIAIIGCGAVTELGHLPAAPRVHGARVTLLIDPNAARREQLARLFHVERTAGDASECPDAFDAAIVAAPHTLHAPITIQLAALGKSILVEKPMASTTPECLAMIEAAEENGVVLAVGLMRRFLWGHQFARKAIASGTFGAVRTFDIQEGGDFWWPIASDFFFRKETAGGGVLVDAGAHTLDMLLQLLGPVADVDYFDDDEGGVEANARLELRMQSGALGTVEFSRMRRLRNTAVIRMERAEMEVALNWNEVKLSLPHEPFVAGGPVTHRLSPDAKQDYLTEIADQMQDFVDSIRDGRRPFVDPRSVLGSIQLMETCYRRRQRLVMPWETAEVPLSPVLQ